MQENKVSLCNIFQYTVMKKMAAVHFTLIPCEHNTANMHVESHIFWAKFVPVRTTGGIVYARFEVFKTFLCDL